MDFDQVAAADFGASLQGIGLNLLVRDVIRLAEFLSAVFDMQVFRKSADFAILTYGDQVFQLHSDATYHSHPLPSLLPESGARGAGIEIRLYNSDPDKMLARAMDHEHEATVLQPPTDKPHGLRECYLLCENGYAWVPSRPLALDERKQVES